MKSHKKYLLFLGILIILSPIGIWLPELLNADEAWGEWSVETVKEQTGHEPSGMKKEADVYHAPVPDYNLGKEDSSIQSASLSYVVSGLIGTGIILILTWGSMKLIARKQAE